MASKTPNQVFLLLLAVVFSVALMFSFIELPRLIDSLLQEKVHFPGLDHGSNEFSAYQSEMFISGLHLRWIGYGSLLIVLGLIVAGFITKKSSLSWIGAFTLFLPVFGQFALSMFFLAGLGILRVGWLPFWDISFQVLDLGNVIYIPYNILMWFFGLFNYWATELIAWIFMALGAFLFTWGVLAWMQAKFGKQGVATSWIYKISRHPQYLGWILWSYGLVLYTPLVNQMKKSWGVQSSLPWLLMTMVIIGICMIEEIQMKKKFGEEYEKYRSGTPFLFPLPKWLRLIIKAPQRLLIKKERPEKGREVGVVISAYTLILIALSFIWIDLGPTKTFPILESRRQHSIDKLVEEINGPLIRRERWRKFNDLARYGEIAAEPMIGFLSSENPENQEFAAALSDDLGDTNAIRPLQKLIDHPWENVRVNALNSLTNLDDPSIDSILLHRINHEEGAYPRIVIFECLGRKKVKEGWSILIDATTADNSRIKLAAVKSMSEIDPAATIPYIIPLLSDESAWVRGTAATLAHKLKAKETLSYLKPLLEDEDYEVRFFAKQAIREIDE